MTTEVWIRNPDNYIREVIEVGLERICFDHGYLVKKHIDPVRFCELYYPRHMDFRVLTVGIQGTAEYGRDCKFGKPLAVYPTWDYNEGTVAELEELLANPVGEQPAICGDTTTPINERPVLGQQHRVLVVHLPISTSGPGRRVIRQLGELQADYPDAMLHVHGLYGYRQAFSHGFGAVDMECRIIAQKGKVTLPNGKEMSYEQTVKVPAWVAQCHMSPVDLEIARNRCMFNIRSAMWAGEYFMENYRFPARGRVAISPDVPPATLPVVTAVDYRARRQRVSAGDKITCDTCSLSSTCKYYREGSVCSVPDSEGAKLATMFQTRDADTVIDGLGRVLAVQTERFQYGVADEMEDGSLDPEVTKIANSILNHGNKLAKLLNPNLASPRVGVTISGMAAGRAANPRSMVARTFIELEEAGIPRDKITEAMVIRAMMGDGPDLEAIESEAAHVRAS